MQLWRADLSIPFVYSGDVNPVGMFIKSVIDNGWFIHNNYIGMPFGLDMRDYPISSSFDFSIIKILSLFSSNYAVVMNLFYLITFPLTTITSVFVFRKLNISFPLSIFGAILYTYIPYHLFRGEGHFFLSQYFLLPLIILVILWIFDDSDLLFIYKNKNKNEKFLINRKTIYCCILCIFIGSTCIYYAFFSCFFLLIAGLFTYFTSANKRNTFSALFLISIIIFIGIINLSPTILYQHEYGPNPTAWARTPGDAEIFGLKIIMLVLPIQNHFIPQFAAINNIYGQNAPLINENIMASLGTIASIGFGLLIGRLLFGKMIFLGKESEPFQKLFNHVSIINISAILLGTIGGFGAIVAYLFPYIRAYNRISIFIAFFSILSVVIYLQIISDKYCKKKELKYFFIIFLVALTLFGIMDTTNANFIPLYDTVKNEYTSDQQFIDQIESTMPNGSMIFQLPYAEFLGRSGPNRIFYYEPLKPYLHSKTLRWSYGAMIQRPGDLWQREISNQPIDTMVESISLSGFSGMWVDSYGYINPDGTISNLSRVLGTNPLTNKDRRYYFFNMSGYNEKLKSKMVSEEYKKRQFYTLNPLIPEWGSGFSVYEGSSDSNWRWVSSSGALSFNNPTQDVREIVIDTTFRTGWSEYANITIKTNDFSDKIIANNLGTHYERKIVIPPGRSIIYMSCDATRVDAPSDSRFLVFRLDNFKTYDIFDDHAINNS